LRNSNRKSLAMAVPNATEGAASARSRERTRGVVLTGFLFALAAGTLWGMTGPLSTRLYAEGAKVTDVGFWRVLLSAAVFALYGLIARRDLFRADRTALLLVLAGGGMLVAVFEVAFQYAIAGVGVASAVALLYTAPVIVAILARPLLGEALTPARLLMAIIVMIGVYLTVNGAVIEDTISTSAGGRGRVVGILGGLLAALSYAGSTLLARFSVPRYGSVKVLFLELVGGTIILAILLPIFGHAPHPPATTAGWVYVMALGAGAVLAANFFFFAAARRIDAAPTAVAASIEPVVGALLAFALLGQHLTGSGWAGLSMVVAGVASGYALESYRELQLRRLLRQ
jgi:drug/metabolite transporter (DMT)-like permease